MIWSTKRMALMCGSLALAFSMMGGQAFAGESQADAVLTSGSLAQTGGLAAGTFAGTLNGTAQQLTGTGFTGFQVTDARGTGVGWTVTALATQFDNATVPGKDIPVNSFTMPQASVTAVGGASAVPGTLNPAAAIDTGAAGVVMASCSATGQGMGVYDFATPAAGWKLAVRAVEYAGSYDSTVTLTVATLP